MGGSIRERLTHELLGADQSTEAGIRSQRERVRALRQVLAFLATAEARRLEGDSPITS